jgi:CrcB protein
VNTLFAVAIGGALGSVLRYLVHVLFARWSIFPWATLLVNVAGCTAMGLLVGYFASRHMPSPEWRAFLGVGVLGGFTTFSTFAFDFAQLTQNNATAALAAAYMASSVLLSVGGYFVGSAVARWLV